MVIGDTKQEIVQSSPESVLDKSLNKCYIEDNINFKTSY